MTTAYAVETCSIGLRECLTSYVAMGWGGGRVLSSGIVFWEEKDLRGLTVETAVCVAVDMASEL
jgi:hypothetical protein